MFNPFKRNKQVAAVVINDVEDELPLPDNYHERFHMWCAEFNVGSKAKPLDSALSSSIKEMVIRNHQKYNHLNNQYQYKASFNA